MSEALEDRPRALTCAAVGPGNPSVERLHVEKKHPPNRLLSPHLMTVTYEPPVLEHAGDDEDELILHPFPSERHATVTYMFRGRPHESPHDLRSDSGETMGPQCG